MEREADEPRRGDRDRSGIEDLGADDQEFAAVEDVGTLPGENPSIDDV